MTSSEIFETETFLGTEILWIEKSEAVACVFPHNQDFAIRRGLKLQGSKLTLARDKLKSPLASYFSA